jgi:hypothetical protein
VTVATRILAVLVAAAVLVPAWLLYKVPIMGIMLSDTIFCR